MKKTIIKKEDFWLLEEVIKLNMNYWNNNDVEEVVEAKAKQKVNAESKLNKKYYELGSVLGDFLSYLINNKLPVNETTIIKFLSLINLKLEKEAK